MLSKLLKAVTAYIMVASTPLAAARETTAPDILLISGDDLGADLACYGNPNVKTPHMDRLASEGVKFKHGWITQASCSPSRSSIMTGLYPHQNGQIGLAHLGFEMSGNFDSIPTLLNDAGYYTGVIGKTHIKPMSSFPFHSINNLGGKKGRTMQAYADGVMDFLEKAGDKPIFLHASFIDPHRPYTPRVDSLPKNPVSAEEITLLPFMEGLEEIPGLKEDTAGYYNAIMRMDAGVGMVLDRLRQAGRLDNTLIILIGDHGAPFGRAKVTCYNPGMHIPFIVKWPGVAKAGVDSTALVSTIDILPTILDAAGVQYTKDLPGKSLRSLVADPFANAREFMFGEFTAHLPADYYPRRTVRTKQYQLIHNLLGGTPNPTPGIEGKAERDAIRDTDLGTTRARTAVQTYMHPPEFELYDLVNDPGCFVNLVGQSEHEQVQAEMLGELMQWREKTDDPLLKDGEMERLGQEIKDRMDTKFSGVGERFVPPAQNKETTTTE